MYKDPTIKVQCGKGNLTEVPNMTFAEPVSILDVSFNKLKTVEKETFCHYKFVNYLHLQHCRLRRISEEAFHCLEKLIFVDLSDNLFTLISPDLFIGNQHLNQLILRGNNLVDLQWNAPLLNGPLHLSKLDLQSCKLKKLSSETFSLLPNLQYIDISYNELEILNYDILSSLQQLNDVNLENNRWKCGYHFYELLRWIKCEKAAHHNRTVQCWRKNGKDELWTPKNQSSLCRLNTTPPGTSSHKTDTTTSWTLNTTVIWFRLNTTPSANSSHETDTTTSLTLNTTVIWSNTSDVSPNTTLNSTTKFEKETDTTVVTALKIALVLVFIAALFVIAIIVVRWCRRRYMPVPTEPLKDDARGDSGQNA